MLCLCYVFRLQPLNSAANLADRVLLYLIRDLKIPGREILGRGIMAEETWGEFTVARRQN